jgi:hypothetical protein
MSFHTRSCFGVLWNSPLCDCGGMDREAKWIREELHRAAWRRAWRMRDAEARSALEASNKGGK